MLRSEWLEDVRLSLAKLAQELNEARDTEHATRAQKALNQIMRLGMDLEIDGLHDYDFEPVRKNENALDDSVPS